MRTILEMLAAASPGATQPVDVPWYAVLFQNPIWLMVILVVVYFFVMAKGSRSKERQRKEMLDQLKKGDRIQTIGGILGTVVEAREGEVVVKVDESANVKMKFVRSAIHRVLEEEKPAGK